MQEIQTELSVSMAFKITFGTDVVAKKSQWSENEFSYSYTCAVFSLNSIKMGPETETIILGCLIGYEMLILLKP